MSTGLHAAREDLHLPHIPTSQGYLHADAPHSMLSKPLSLSPRTFGMEDLRDFCGPLGTFKTGLTPRVFSTGLTPRSGFTPRFTTGFTPRIATSGLSGPDTNSFFSRNTGFSPRQNDGVSKISPTGFTPKDMSGMKVPMRFPNSFAATPQKMEPQHHHQQQPMSQPMQHKAMHAPPAQQPHMQHMQPPQQQQHPEMNHMSMMYDYMHHRPTIPQQTMMAAKPPQQSVSPSMSEDGDPEDLDERRRMKNRERVRKCRKRKQDRLNFLEDRTAELEKENGTLRAKLARKSVGVKSEPLTEAQVKELRKKQNTTLASYVRAYNESSDAAFATGAKTVWAENAEIVYGSNGTSIAGVDTIISNKAASAAVFSQYKIKNYHVQWKESSQEKCLVHWEIEAILKKGARNDVPLTAPFAELAAHYGDDEVVTIHAISHLTFDEGKVVEETRQLNLSQMADSILNKFAAEAGKASEILRCLMKA